MPRDEDGRNQVEEQVECKRNGCLMFVGPREEINIEEMPRYLTC